jgi:hypothetical protein
VWSRLLFFVLEKKQVDSVEEEKAQWEEFNKVTATKDHSEMRRIKRMVAKLRTREPLRDFDGKVKCVVRNSAVV